MHLLKNADERAIQCDVFEETISLKPHHLITLSHQAGSFNYYVTGEAVRRDHDWIVPLQVIAEADEAEARLRGTIAHFAEGEDGSLA